MPRQQRIRGQEATIRITEIGSTGVSIPLSGSFFKVRDFSWNDVGDLKEDGFIGEVADDIDYQNHGFAGSFSIDKANAAATDYVRRLVTADRLSLKPPEITIVVTFVFRELGVPPDTLVFTNGIMMMASESIAGRKEFINNSFEWKCKHLL